MTKILVGGVEQDVKIYAGVPEPEPQPVTCARHTMAQNIDTAVRFNDGRLTPGAAFACCDRSVGWQEVYAAAGLRLPRNTID